jgi:predicted metal-binding membrane protein
LTSVGGLEYLLRRDRLLVGACLFIVTAVSWIYILAGAGMNMTALEMTHPDNSGMDMDMVMPVAWDLSYTVMMFFMWWIMMIAMMLPSATPAILLSAALNRRSTADVPPFGNAAIFTLAYLLAWALFSLAAILTHWLLEQAGLLSMLMESASSILSGVLLLLAGAWQFSPVKQSCLRHCQSPIVFLTQHRRPGNSGALLMGLHHGVYCLGCCWFLMALLFVGGVMNLYWILGLAIFVYLEKVLSLGSTLGKVVGYLLIFWGAALIIASI